MSHVKGNPNMLHHFMICQRDSGSMHSRDYVHVSRNGREWPHAFSLVEVEAKQKYGTVGPPFAINTRIDPAIKPLNDWGRLLHCQCITKAKY